MQSRETVGLYRTFLIFIAKLRIRPSTNKSLPLSSLPTLQLTLLKRYVVSSIWPHPWILKNISVYLLFGVSKKKKKTLRFVKDRIIQKIQSWKHSALSLSGCEVLIKAVAMAIPTYPMNCFIFPITLSILRPLASPMYFLLCTSCFVLSNAKHSRSKKKKEKKRYAMELNAAMHLKKLTKQKLGCCVLVTAEPASERLISWCDDNAYGFGGIAYSICVYYLWVHFCSPPKTVTPSLNLHHILKNLTIVSIFIKLFLKDYSLYLKHKQTSILNTYQPRSIYILHNIRSESCLNYTFIPKIFYYHLIYEIMLHVVSNSFQPTSKNF